MARKSEYQLLIRTLDSYRIALHKCYHTVSLTDKGKKYKKPIKVF